MGIPSFYRWVKERYPKCVVSAKEVFAAHVDTSRRNPNGLEFDNLYLDLNGIIHPCFHPEDLPGPKIYEEVFEAVYKYIDRIFAIVRPRKLLFLAIDGVAPRAKMNQQRSRRFRAAKDAAGNVLGETSSETWLDSNVITPGTEFMDLLSSALRYYIHLRMNDDLGWRGIKVILSDASVPGEGEHKIMSFIRLQRNMPGYDPNTRHCLYGLDADLIMLALATHEIHFSVLREDFQKKSGKHAKRIRRRKIQKKKKRPFVSKKKPFVSNMEDYIKEQRFQFVNIWILREYLAHDMNIPSLTMEANLERLIDDFVFMCLFVGNDFLPHIPSLEISEGAINLLMRIYTKEFSERGGYLTNSFEVNLRHVEHFIRSIAAHEHKILKKHTRINKESMICSRGLSDSKLADDSSKLPFVERNTGSGNQGSSLECKISPVSQDPQNIELGWKERYYTEKFEAELPDDRERVRRHAVTKYIEGICWVMRYYYEGVCSWQWFYPYHYAPFASDFYDIDQLKFCFELGEPFKPFDQLLSVLPTARKLMTDVSSPISDFYPTDFQLDMNGKRFSWQAICKLPFIDESRLLSEIAKVEHTLTDEERRRNSLGLDILFLHISHTLALEINSFSKRMNDSPELVEGKVEQKIDPKFSGGMNGYIYISDKSLWPVEIPSPVQGMKMIAKNEVLFVLYKNPSFHPHIPNLPAGIILPEESVSVQDVLSARKRLVISGQKFSGRPIKLASGTNLAQCAHSLVSQNCLGLRMQLETLRSQIYLRMQLEALRSMILNNHVGPADALVEMKTEEDKSGTEEDKSGERNVTNIVGKLDSCIVRKETEEREDLAGAADGLEEITKVKSRKRKQRSKKMNNSEIQGVSNNNVEKSESCVLEEKSKVDDHQAVQDRLEEVNIKGDDGPHKIVEILDNSSSRECNQGDGEQGSAHDLQEIKVEVGSRKRKRKSKKTKQNKSDSEPNNIAEKLESRGLQEKSNSDELKVKGDSAPNNIVEKLESSSFREQNQGDGDQGSAHGLREVKVEVGLRKKRKPKGKKQNESESAPNNMVEKLESSFLEEKSKADDHNADQHGCEELKAKGDSVSHNIVEKLESCTAGQPSDGKGEQADGGGGGGGGEVGLRKRKRKPKRKKQNENESAPNVIVEKLESSFLKEKSKADDHNADQHGCEELKAKGDSVTLEKLESCTAGQPSEGKGEHAEGGGGEVGLRKKKHKPKRKKQNVNKCAPNNIVEKLESSFLKEKNKADNHDVDQQACEELKAKGDSVPHDIVKKLESRNPGQLSEDRGEHADGDGGGGGVAGINGLGESKVKAAQLSVGRGGGGGVGGGGGESAGINGLGELKVGVESNRKSRSKKRKLSEGDGVSHNVIEKLESSSTVEQNQGNDQASADGLLETKVEVVSKKKTRRSKKRAFGTLTDAAPINIVDKMESSHMEKRDSNGEHTVAV